MMASVSTIVSAGTMVIGPLPNEEVVHTSSSHQRPDYDPLDPCLLPGLPNDLALQCLVRVPRRCHSKLAMVCKQWKELLLGKDYYLLRKQMSLSEGWIYTLSRDKSELLHWYVLDPVERKWKQLPPMPGDCQTRYGMACEVLDTQLFVLGGGRKYGGPSSEVVVYDSVSNKWRVLEDMVTARCYFVSAAVDGRLYAVGGMGTTSGCLTSWDVYDSDGQCWSSSEDPNIAPDLGEALVVEGNIYTRHVCPNNFSLSYAAVYNPKQNVWALVDDEMTRKWCGPTAVAGKDVYMLDQTFGLKLMVLDKETRTWNAFGRLSPMSIQPPCRIAVVGRNLYVVGRGLRTTVLDVDRVGELGGLLVTSSIQGPKGDDSVILSCHVLEM